MDAVRMLLSGTQPPADAYRTNQSRLATNGPLGPIRDYEVTTAVEISEGPRRLRRVVGCMFVFQARVPKIE